MTMHYQTAHAVEQTKAVAPIRCKLEADCYYHLRAANGEKRVIGAGSANTCLANAQWPKRGANAVLWVNARAVEA